MSGNNRHQANCADATILVVDDDSAIRDMLYETLQLEGYHVVTASDGLEAIERLEEIHPDLVVSDVMMPMLDGGHLARIVSVRNGVPVVGMTALSRLRREADCYFAVVLHKPFMLDQLLETIESLLARREQDAPLHS